MTALCGWDWVDPRGGLGAEDVGQGRARGAEREGADLEEAAAGDAVAEPLGAAKDGQHGKNPFDKGECQVRKPGGGTDRAYRR